MMQFPFFRPGVAALNAALSAVRERMEKIDQMLLCGGDLFCRCCLLFRTSHNAILHLLRCTRTVLQD